MNIQALDRSVGFIKSWLQFRYDREEIPGYVVAIAHKGKVLMNEAHGYADLEKQITLTPQHSFRIASHSKTFTATALMQLQEQGKLRIDDHVADYLPWLQQHRDTRWYKVTIRQLMSHSAGVIRDGFHADYWQLERPFPDENELQAEILEADLIVDANTKLKYSNFGYSLLGLVIAAVSGQPYNQYVNEHIIQPLGLAHTGPEYDAGAEPMMVTGYTGREVNKTRLPIAHVDTRAMAAATGFYSTAEDLVKYFTAQFPGSGQLLDDESKKEMQRAQWHAKRGHDEDSEDYGLGIDIVHLKDRKTIGHGGGFPGHITKSMADPEDQLVVTVLTNCLDSPATEIAKSIYHIIDYYQQNTPDAPTKHDLTTFEGRYINLWAIHDIVATGDKIVVTSAHTWQPLERPEKLEYIDETTLRIVDTSSFLSEDELVHFTFKDGLVESINYAGYTMWPEAVWIQKQSDRDKVELH